MLLFFSFFAFGGSFFRIVEERVFFKEGERMKCTVESIFHNKSMIQKIYSFQPYCCNLSNGNPIRFIDNLLGFLPTELPFEIPMKHNILMKNWCEKKLGQEDRFLLLNLLKFEPRIKISFGGKPVLSNFSHGFYYGYPLGKDSHINNHINLLIHYVAPDEMGNMEIILVQSLPTISLDSQYFKPNTNFNIIDGNSIKYKYSVEFIEYEYNYLIPKVTFVQYFWSFIFIDMLIVVVIFARLFFAKRKALMIDSDNQYQNGWIIIRNDILRPPIYIEFLSSAIGIGIQILLAFVMTNCKAYSSYSSALCYLIAYIISFSLIGGLISNIICYYLAKHYIGYYHNIVLIAPTPLIICFLSSIYFIEQASNTLNLRSCIILFGLSIVNILCFHVGGLISVRIKMSSIYDNNYIPLPKSFPKEAFYKNTFLLSIFSGAYIFSRIVIPVKKGLDLFWSQQVFENNQSDLFQMLFLLVSSSSVVSIYFSIWKIEQMNYKWWDAAVCTTISSGVVMLLFLIIDYYYRIQDLLNISFVVYVFICFLLCGSLSFISCGVSMISTLFVVKKFMDNIGVKFI
ncbi:hypothetical protein TRFO_28556 [Tritrichomonas foetus]|uniref:Transmembrane 9 superfamily member n=1 Tax=Tritrichomonas foetus TaxID=1144522 RepID=A0A1J4JXY5_9EUKA|nr:hypothetical protein TRFO_28556 [Tritrichomonas foetus]|eukprot:OHT04017.1 hypothetical protein TRFO_28556 [Tritrichomonas foetus]